MRARTEDIKFDPSLYPRIGIDNDYLELLSMAPWESLPPIRVTPDLTLIDGNHRLTRAKMELRAEIDVEVEDIPLGKVLVRAIELNATHGKQLTMGEKRKLAPRLYTNGHRDAEALVALLGVSRQFINKWTDKLREEEDLTRNQQVLDLYLQGLTQEEIAEKLVLTQQGVSQVLINTKKATEGKICIPDPPQIGDVWTFTNCDDQYGLSGFPGRIPGQIAENLLHFYTEPFDLVVDPMAGGGTTLDVCRAMYRRYLCWDLHPVRDGIGEHDIRGGYPARARGCDFIILDPPYYHKKDGDYAQGSLSDLPRSDYLDAFKKLAQDSHKVLRKGGHLALIISSYVDEESLLESLWSWDYVAMFQDAHCLPIREIQCPLTTQSLHAYHVKKFRQDRRMARLTRSIVVFRKCK